MKNAKDGLVVIVRQGSDYESSVDRAIRNFTKMVRNSGILQEVLERQHYEKPSVRRRKKHAAAVRARRNEEKED